MSDENVLSGTVKIFNQFKGYGFITREKGRDVFFHFKDIEADEKDASLFEGDPVNFILGSKDGKARALKVKRIS